MSDYLNAAPGRLDLRRGTLLRGNQRAALRLRRLPLTRPA